MAVYEYTCRQCQAHFEVTCRIAEHDAKAVCPKCGSRDVAQKFTAEFSSPPPEKY